MQAFPENRRQVSALWRLVIGCFVVAWAVPMYGQLPTDTDRPRQPNETALEARVTSLEREVAELKAIIQQLHPASAPTNLSPAPEEKAAVTLERAAVVLNERPAPAPLSDAQNVVQPALQPQDRSTLDFLRDTTINLSLDTYYEYNFNQPVGRVNLLRAYDVLSNEFSLSQASLVVEHAPDPAAGRRWGGRLDLQFGQATDTLQGNPSNEPRPDIYRNIFQAFGTYVFPGRKTITVDFGKWASSLGLEGNYTKDQMNYTRSFWFYFLPFYHMGARVSMPLNDRFGVNYWLVNGANQVEATNGFKDQLFGFTARPKTSVNWTMNYYLGQEHPDRAPATNCGPIPVQPGLCFTAINPAPNGHTSILDTYATWKATPKLTFALEGDYFIQRLWQNAAPGESSAPSHTDGGAAYLQYQFTPRLALAARAEYLSDRGGFFSGITQALKENTVTFDYKVADGMLMRYEWRRDFSNQPSFLTTSQGVLSKEQNTATMGLLWWWGRKEGSW
jgi:Putative beta-barrel porin-2, OmpL-like. bbp2